MQATASLVDGHNVLESIDKNSNAINIANLTVKSAEKIESVPLSKSLFQDQ